MARHQPRGRVARCNHGAAIQAALPAASPGWSHRTFRITESISEEPRMFFRARADDIPVRIQQARASAPIAGYALGKVKRWLHEVALPKINSNDLYVSMTSSSPYTGILVVDKPRHRLDMGFTRDRPRMNTMPEWFTAEPEGNYIVEDLNTGAFQTYTGTQLHDGLPVTLEAGVETLLLIRPE